MGQYYHVITECNGKKEFYDIQMMDFVKSEMLGKADFILYNGLKLMEHSWVGNDFTEAFSETLMNNPTKVCWCGDYAEEEECKEFGFEYKDVWKEKREEYKHLKETSFTIKRVGYLVNKTKKEYINLREYIKNSSRGGWCIYPLSLLCALGNGRGGGDYHEVFPCIDFVGKWAFDEVYFTNDLPEGYQKLDLMFVEEQI